MHEIPPDDDTILAFEPPLALPLPPALPASPRPTRPPLHAGDVVAVNQSLVNCREWMSTAAGVRAILARGERAELLSEPVHSCGSDWVKLRPLAAGIECYAVARFVDLIEKGPAAPSAAISPAPALAGAGAPYEAGDLIVTATKVNLRSGPAHSIIQQLPSNLVGAVLAGPVMRGTVEWVHVRFPHVSGWVAVRYTRLFASGEKWIEVDLSSQTLVAWDDATEASRSPISSGKPGFATPTGAFTILDKFPARRTKATVREESWDIPGVPWVMVFREGGFCIHGVYWHDDFGAPVSHGCVTLPVPSAEWLYHWAPLGAPLWIHS